MPPASAWSCGTHISPYSCHRLPCQHRPDRQGQRLCLLSSTVFTHRHQSTVEIRYSEGCKLGCFDDFHDEKDQAVVVGLGRGVWTDQRNMEIVANKSTCRVTSTTTVITCITIVTIIIHYCRQLYVHNDLNNKSVILPTRILPHLVVVEREWWPLILEKTKRSLWHRKSQPSPPLSSSPSPSKASSNTSLLFPFWLLYTTSSTAFLTLKGVYSQITIHKITIFNHCIIVECRERVFWNNCFQN